MRRYAFLIPLLVAIVISVVLGVINQPSTKPIVHAAAPPVRDIQSELLTKQYVAALDVARVFGRAPGCTEADPKLITAVAVESINDGLDPRIFAALVATESACDPLAISHSGAVGLTQINVKIWKAKFDFSAINLLNQNDSLHTGGPILADMIKQFGLNSGLRHYNGMGEGCPTCDDTYVPRIIALAAGKK